MTVIKPLNAKLSVAPQITLEEIPGLAAQGYRTLILNRPEGETPDQPSNAEVEAAAKAAGMRFLHIPLVSGQFPDATLDQFKRAYASEQTKILAYCRSGMRSACLWAIAEGKTSGTDAVLKTAADAGFNISGIRSIVDQHAS